jgi:hypothetical protein
LDEERTMKKTVIEVDVFNLYGTDRFGIHGVHPGERMEEQFRVEYESEADWDDEGDLVATHTQPAEWARVFEVVKNRCRHLLSIWKDQRGVKVFEAGCGGDPIMTVYKGE